MNPNYLSLKDSEEFLLSQDKKIRLYDKANNWVGSITVCCDDPKDKDLVDPAGKNYICGLTASDIMVLTMTNNFVIMPLDVPKLHSPTQLELARLRLDAGL
jgi:hypothetical protein